MDKISNIFQIIDYCSNLFRLKLVFITGFKIIFQVKSIGLKLRVFNL